ncbi:MAG TPA: DinB family protein [Acidimicrobiales bacterium]|nr:DinB family protein [Acidimicrobiales bacterium]
MGNELILDSLRRRMRAMHSLYEDATATMGPEQVNHVERDAVLPIAFSLFHYVNMEDTTYPVIAGGGAAIWNDEWSARVELSIDDHGKERTPEEMVEQRIGDYDAFIEYMNEVWARTEAFLAQLDAGDLENLIVPRPFPPVIASTYSARVAGEVGITLLDATECWWYQHGLRHMGEIEHARALVGLEGMTS